MMHISSSTGLNLSFPDNELYDEYEAAIERVHVLAYAKLREQYGIWCGNQSKFVATMEEMNDWDSKFMENLWIEYGRPLGDVPL